MAKIVYLAPLKSWLKICDLNMKHRHLTHNILHVYKLPLAMS